MWPQVLIIKLGGTSQLYNSVLLCQNFMCAMQKSVTIDQQVVLWKAYNFNWQYHSVD